MKINSTEHVKQSEQFELINPHAAGIDIGSRFHYVCVGGKIKIHNLFASSIALLQTYINWLIG